jgi:thiol:disulfide interchange protein
MLNNAEMLGRDDKAEVLREEIKEQLCLSNEECGITREEQSVICLQQVKWKDKEKKEFKESMIYHQQKTDHNAREYQKRRIEIKALYAELEDLGWNQMISEDDHEADYQSSDDGEAYMRANANAARRMDRERETPEERRARRARNIHGQPAVVDISDEDNMDVDGRVEQAAQARAAAPQAAAPQAAAPQAAPQAPIAPGSVEAAQAHAMRAAQALAAERAVHLG